MKLHMRVQTFPSSHLSSYSENHITVRMAETFWSDTPSLQTAASGVILTPPWCYFSCRSLWDHSYRTSEWALHFPCRFMESVPDVQTPWGQLLIKLHKSAGCISSGKSLKLWKSDRYKQGNLHNYASVRLSDRGRWSVSAAASPALSFVTPWSQFLCHCPNCPGRSLPSHFRKGDSVQEPRVDIRDVELHCVVIKAVLITWQTVLKHLELLADEPNCTRGNLQTLRWWSDQI